MIFHSSRLIYKLLYVENKYKEIEDSHFNAFYRLTIPDLSDILLHDAYGKVIGRMSVAFVKAQFQFMSERCFNDIMKRESYWMQ